MFTLALYYSVMPQGESFFLKKKYILYSIRASLNPIVYLRYQITSNNLKQIQISVRGKKFSLCKCLLPPLCTQYLV